MMTDKVFLIIDVINYEIEDIDGMCICIFRTICRTYYKLCISLVDFS